MQYSIVAQGQSPLHSHLHFPPRPQILICSRIPALADGLIDHPRRLMSSLTNALLVCALPRTANFIEVSPIMARASFVVCVTMSAVVHAYKRARNLYVVGGHHLSRPTKRIRTRTMTSRYSREMHPQYSHSIRQQVPILPSPGLRTS